MEIMKNKKIRFLTFLFILVAVVIIVMMYYFYKQNNENVTADNTNEEIALEGIYSEGNVGHVYEFYRDGTAIEEDEIVTCTGRYKTIGKNQIRVTLTKKITYDMDSSKKEVENINESYNVTIIDENTLKVTGVKDKTQYDFEITKILK